MQKPSNKNTLVLVTIGYQSAKLLLKFAPPTSPCGAKYKGFVALPQLAILVSDVPNADTTPRRRPPTPKRVIIHVQVHRNSRFPKVLATIWSETQRACASMVIGRGRKAINYFARTERRKLSCAWLRFHDSGRNNCASLELFRLTVRWEERGWLCGFCSNANYVVRSAHIMKPDCTISN